MSKRLGFGVMTAANLLIEVFLGVRASVVYAFLYGFFAPPAWELWSLQALVIVVVSSTGFGVSLYRLVLVDRIKQRHLPAEEEQAALRETRKRNSVLLWIIISNDIAGAVFPSLQAIPHFHLPDQWPLIPGALLLAVGMSAFSFVPFYSADITTALADLIPAERIQKMQQRTKEALLEQDASMTRINSNAQVRFEHAAQKLPPTQVLSVTLPYLTQKAQGDERLAATMQQMQEMMRLVTQDEQRRALNRQQVRSGKTKVEADEDDEEEARPPEMLVKGRDYDASGEIMAVQRSPQLLPAASERMADTPVLDIAEGLEEGHNLPFVNGV